MVTWLKTGHDYHTEHDLKTCLLCGNHFAQERKDALTAMLNGKIGETLSLLNRINNEASEIDEAVSLTTSTWPRPVDFDLELQTEYEQALKTLNKSLKEIHALIIEARRIVRVRLAELTSTVSHSLPEKDSVAAKCETLQAAITAINSLIREHNTQIADFADRQEQARLSIRQHYLAEGHEDYVSVQDAVSEAAESIGRIQDNIQSLEEKARALRARVRTHSPAAQKITKLVHAYLGHGELTIIAAEEGYELHRHGEIVRGSPSEGEKTAIALCYFLSTLESEGRAIKDLIVVVDDPISSLDTKAMNYACALILSCLSNASQVFVLTHNQHCMNEFRKAWRHLAEPRNRETDPTAKLLYMDVRLPEGTEQRTAHIIEMPPLLRTYDSEYHFLCHKVLEFEAMGEGHSPYGFMMPNVIRRVLEVFLAFKVPGSAPIKDKLAKLCKEHGDLDPVRILALERLTQVESHSDSLDDLITHSSMTVEEARDANAALLELMAAADSNHTAAIRRQCRFET